jgi:alpha-mannosidase
MTIKDLLLLHHSHTDIGYTNYQSSVFALQRGHIRNAITLAERYADNPPGEQFKWTCEVTIIVEDFIKQATDREIERLQAVHEQGLIDFGGMYCNVSPLFTADMLMRSLTVAESLRKDYGFDIRYALNCDVNGQSWALVDMLLDAGFEGMAMAINRAMAPDPQPRPIGFYWQAPSGRQILTWHGEHYGDGNNLGIPRFPTPTMGKNNWGYDLEKAHHAVTNYIQQLEDRGYTQDFAFLQIIGSYQWDNDGPDELMVRFVQEWNKRGWTPRLSMVTLDEMFARIQTDEVRTGAWTDWWAQGMNSSAYETALNRETHRRVYAVQQLGGLLQNLPEPPAYPLDEDQTVWRDMALYDEHTWGSSESITHADSMQARGQWARKATFAYDAAFGAIRLQQHVMRDLAGRIPMTDEPHAVIYNPLPYERQVQVYLPPVYRSGWELHRMERDLELGSPQGLTGQRVDYGVVTLPAGGYRILPLQIEEAKPLSLNVQTPEFAPRSHKQTSQVKCHGWRLENQFYRLEIDPVSGGIRNLNAGGVEWVDDSTPWYVGHYIHETITAAGQREDIQLPPPDEDYDYRPHLAPQRHGPSRVTEKRFEAGVASGRLFMRLDAPGADDVYMQVVLYDDLPWIDLIYDINKQLTPEPESVYIAFPFALTDPVPRYEIAGAIVEAETQQLINACRDHYAVQHWVDVSNNQRGMALATPDVPLLHIGGFNNYKHQEALEIGQPLIVSWPMNNHWWTNFKRDQSGWVRLRYRLWPHDAPFDPVAVTRFGMDAAVEPLVGPLIDRGQGMEHRTATAPTHLEPQGKLFSLEPENVRIVGFQPTEDEVIIRLQEFAGQTAEYTLHLEGAEPISGTIEPFRLQTRRIQRP